MKNFNQEKLLYYAKKYLNEMWNEDKMIEINFMDIGAIYLSNPNEKNDRFLNVELNIDLNDD